MTSNDVYVASPKIDGGYPVERKVWWAGLGSYAGMFLMYLVLSLYANPDLIKTWPEWLEMLLLPVLPALAAVATAYQAKHQARNNETGQVAPRPYEG